VLIDVDADGLADTVRTYTASAAPAAGDWHLRVELATGGGTDVALPDDPAPAALRVIGGSYIGSNVDPGPQGARASIFVVTGAGASASIVTVFWLDGCNLARMTVGGVGEAAFAVGGGVVHAENLRCEGVAGTALLVYREIVTNDGGASFDVTDTAYTRSGADLVVYGAGPQTSNQPSMPSVPSLIDCSGVVSP
jgi:hypothetical protein